MPKELFNLYLHSDDEGQYEEIEQWERVTGIKFAPEAKSKFCRALYEVHFIVEVDTETGDYKIISIKEVGDRKPIFGCVKEILDRKKNVAQKTQAILKKLNNEIEALEELERDFSRTSV